MSSIDNYNEVLFSVYSLYTTIQKFILYDVFSLFTQSISTLQYSHVIWGHFEY